MVNPMNEHSSVTDADAGREILTRMQEDPAYRLDAYTLLARNPEGVRALLTRIQKSEDTDDGKRILTALRRQSIVALRYQEVLAFLKEALLDARRAPLHDEIIHTIGAGGVPAAQSAGMREALIASTDWDTVPEGTRRRAVAALACIRE